MRIVARKNGSPSIDQVDVRRWNTIGEVRLYTFPHYMVFLNANWVVKLGSWSRTGESWDFEMLLAAEELRVHYLLA
jgi:hypothetical protein